MNCPECGRSLEPKKNRFGVALWPRHNWRRITIDHMDGPELDRWYADHRHGRGANETDVCPMSGQPVD